MTMDRLINILIPVLLIEMMAAIGLHVSFRDLGSIVKNGRLMLGTVLANYLCVPAVAVALLLLVDAKPMVAVGFLILAVCPGAPFGPSCTALARGNVPVAVGLMTFLAVTSAIVAPVLLHVLTPFVAGSDSLHVDVVKIFRTLSVTQLLPLLVGLCIRHWLPKLATWLQKPADKLTSLLSLLTVIAILYVHFHLLLEIRLRGYMAMTALLVASWVAGWFLAGPDYGIRKTMALTTALRNVGVGLVIATASFPNTAAVTAGLAYGLFEILGCVLLALWWGWRASSSATSQKTPTTSIER